MTTVLTIEQLTAALREIEAAIPRVTFVCSPEDRSRVEQGVASILGFFSGRVTVRQHGAVPAGTIYLLNTRVLVERLGLIGMDELVDHLLTAKRFVDLIEP